MNHNLIGGATHSLTLEVGRPIRSVASRLLDMACQPAPGRRVRQMPGSQNRGLPCQLPDHSARVSVTPTLQDSTPGIVLEQSYSPTASRSSLHTSDALGETLPVVLTPVLPQRIRLAFFGPQDIVRTRPAFISTVRSAAAGILERSSFCRHRNSTNGVPFLVLSVRNSADLAAIWRVGLLPFVHDTNTRLGSCRLALHDELRWMSYPQGDDRNTPHIVHDESRAEVPLRNRFELLSNSLTTNSEPSTDAPVAVMPIQHPKAADTPRDIVGKFRAGCLNVRGLKIASQPHKASELCAILREKQVAICAVQETWLDPALEEIVVPNYFFVGTSGYQTISRLGGGTGFFVSNALAGSVSGLHWKGKKYHQATWVKVKGPNRLNTLIFGSVYIRPVSNARGIDDVYTDIAHLTADIDYLSKKGKVLVSGDFNARIGRGHNCAEGPQRLPPFGEATVNAEGKAVTQMLSQCDLYCLANRHGPNTEYTCIRAQGESVVDYWFGGPALLKCSRSVTHHPVDDDTDHVLLCLDVPTKLVRRLPQPKATIRWRIENLKVDSIAQDYSDRVAAGATAMLAQIDNMTTTATQQDVDRIAGEVTQVMVGAANATIGRKISKGSKTAPWWCKEYNDARVQSQILYEKAQRSKDASDWAAFVAARKTKNTLKRSLKLKQAAVDESQTARVWASNYGSKEAWIAAKRLRNARAGTSSVSTTHCQGIHNEAGEVIDKPVEVAEVFRTHYKKLATPGDVVGYDTEHHAHVEHDVKEWQTIGKEVLQDEYDGAFTEAEMEAAIDKLPMHKAEDGEGIIGELVRHGGGILQALILRVINWVWELETVPDKWGEGIVVNLYKAGDAMDPGNYRGITLIPIMRKLFSTMIRLRLEKRVTLHESQAAFRPKRSCLDHIFTLSQIIHETGAVKKSLYVFFLDIKKAYDTVWRAGLFFKLKEKGVKGKMWRVLLDMFSKARSCVRVGGELSTMFDLMVGVGQGDPLSTLLFDIFIDDLLVELHTQRANSGVKLSRDASMATVATAYADDVGCVSHEADGLQASIDHVARWLNKWRMEPNVSKSAVMVFHPRDGEAACVPEGQRAHTWNLNGHILSQKDSYKYLGVWFTENGSWDLHASKALAKMRSALGYWEPLLSCNRLSVNARAMMIQTLVYSAGLYGCEVWSATSAMRDSFDVVAKDAIRSVMGLQRFEATSDALLMDLGLLAPSLLMDAAKQCYLRHLNVLADGRWCKAALTCRFDGQRAAGRPRAGANWLGEVHKCSQGICTDLNVAELAIPIGEQEPVRRVSRRNTRRGSPSHAGGDSVEAVASEHAPLNRKVILDMFWAWKSMRMQAKYTTAPPTQATWFTGCVDPLKRCRAGYLSSLPSCKSRLILSARSGKLFALQHRLTSGERTYIPPTEYCCPSCDEQLGDARTACVHCMVDCPTVWPKLDEFFASVRDLGGRGVAYAEHLEALLGADLVKAMINPKKDFVPEELTVAYWSAVADLLMCNVSVNAGQGLGQVGSSGQASTGAILGSDGGDLVGCELAQAVLGDANVHEDAVMV